MNEQPLISVVIPTYNRAAYLEQALTAVLNQRYPADRYEVIVVNDASTDGTADLLESWQSAHSKRLRVLHQATNRGPAAARNRGVHEARGSLIAFIDDDCVAAPDWLDQIQRSHQERKTVAVGGQVLPLFTESPIQRYYARHSVIARPAMQEGEVIYIVTANAAFNRNVLLEVDGFDEQVTFAGGEDPDLCFRLRRLGYELHYNPAVYVYHRYASSWRSFANTFFRYGRGTAFYEMRNEEPSHLGHLRRSLLMLVGPYRLWQHYRQRVRGMDLLAFALLDNLRALSFLLGLRHGYSLYRKHN